MFIKPHSYIVVASKQELTDDYYYRRLWIAMRNMATSRRQWMDKIADAIYDYEGEILTSDGRKYPIPDIDDVLNDRTIGNFLQSLDGEPRRRARNIEPLRLYDLYFRIKHPKIARHFGR